MRGAKEAIWQACAVGLVEHMFHTTSVTAHCGTLQGLRGLRLRATIPAVQGEAMQDTIDPFAEFLVTIQGLWVNAIAFLTGVMQPGWRQN